MRYMKHLGLAVLVAVAAFAVVGGASASATVLCKEAKSPCPSDYAAGSSVTLSLKSETLSTYEATGLGLIYACGGTTINGTTANTGGKGAAVNSSVSEMTFENCTYPTEMVKSGELQVTHIVGGHNGTVVARNYEIEILMFGFIKCLYGAGKGTHLGTLSGGSPATVKVNAILLSTGGEFGCPETGNWRADYVVTSPSPLYVEAE